MRGFLIISALTLAALPAAADYNLNGKVIDCYCTDSSGARVDLGETICLQVDGRMFMAQCQMSLNVPMWREVSEGCLSSGLSSPSIGAQSIDPGIDTGRVDAEITPPKS
ncbi:hypothetical protein [Shimia sp. SDUM112013]|uniref:hypothetical protein n=1 Tax=Shimia sp. SDUM112013 TaxID=3136160 RepID=UPI0032ECA5D7